MQVFSVAGYRFKAMTDRVAKVQNGAQSGFCFVLSDEFGFYFAAAGNNSRENSRIAAQHRAQIAFQISKERRIVYDSVLDDLRQASAKLAIRQRFQNIEITNYQTRLIKGADKV